MSDVLRYEEPALVEQLAALPSERAALFAAACAERLAPLCADGPDVLTRGLAVAWQAPGPSPDEVDRLREAVEAAIPDDEDEGWTAATAYAQHCLSAVAYALRTRLSGDPQEAAWAARQVHEAADFTASSRLTGFDPNQPGAEQRLLAMPIVQEALAGIVADLETVRRGNDLPVEELVRILHAQAREGGRRLLALSQPAT